MSRCNATEVSGTMPKQISRNLAQQLHTACAKDQLPKYKELQVLSSSDENKVDSAQDRFRNAAVQQHNAGAHQCDTTQLDKRHAQIHTSLPAAMPHHIPCMQLIA